MARQRSRRYFEIRDGQAEQLADPTWAWAPKWRNRVGLQRMTASEVAFEATSLLGDVNLSTHRDDAELAGLLEAARAAVFDYAVAVSGDNWDRLLRHGRHASEATGE